MIECGLIIMIITGEGGREGDKGDREMFEADKGS